MPTNDDPEWSPDALIWPDDEPPSPQWALVPLDDRREAFRVLCPACSRTDGGTPVDLALVVALGAKCRACGDSP